jgi:hypothetical protein
MPRIGVYQFAAEERWLLLDALIGTTSHIDNRHVLYIAATNAFWDIESKVKKGKLPYFVGREMWRSLSEKYEEAYGMDAPPSFGDGYALDEWAQDLAEYIAQQGPEFEVFGDDIDIDPEFNGYDFEWFVQNMGCPEALVQHILDVNPEIPELFVYVYEDDLLYVIKSETVEHCSADMGDYPGMLNFESLADADRQGNVPTYVLPDDLFEEWARILKIEEERKRARSHVA